MRANIATFCTLLVATAPLVLPANANGDDDIVIERDINIPMRDDIVLRADVYRPARRGPFPVLVYRTPYGKDAAARSYRTHLHAVARGYAVVLQDVRGRYASGGDFDPYRHEGRDGYDTIEWAAAQPWSNGKVGSYGLSYPGAVQWLAAMQQPPHLKAMVPAMTFSSPRNFFYMNGVFDLSWLPWIYNNIAPDRRQRLDLPARDDDASWATVVDDYRSYRPLIELPWLRREAPFYFAWLQHSPASPWWDWAELRGRYAQTDAAVLSLSGWYDEAYGPEGAVTNFRGLRAARDGNPPRTELVLGPWTHGVGATGSRTTGDLDFGPAAAIDYDAVVLDFLDRHLQNDADSSASPVRYFLMGEIRWRTATTWPPEDAQDVALYLGVAEHGAPQLSADRPPGGNSSSSFVSDPAKPVTDPYDSFGPHDYRKLAARDDLLSFDTQPFKTDVILAGEIRAIVHAACNCRDFDLWVRLQHVYPDGRAINLMSPGNDVLRASYRDKDQPPQYLEPGRAYELRLGNLHTAISLPAGHRLRVQLSANFAPHFSTNPQTGQSEIHSTATQPATITILHDAEHPSRLLLPVLNR